MFLVSGFAVYHLCAPPTHWPRLLRGFGARLPVRPQGAPCSAALGHAAFGGGRHISYRAILAATPELFPLKF
jgi:hypothetical protein